MEYVISEIERNIQKKRKKLKKLEKDYDELISMKLGMTRALEKYQYEYEKKQKVFKNPMLYNNQAMQKFCQSMSEMTSNSRYSRKLAELTESISEITKKANATMREIDLEEENIKKLEIELETKRIGGGNNA